VSSSRSRIGASDCTPHGPQEDAGYNPQFALGNRPPRPNRVIG